MSIPNNKSANPGYNASKEGREKFLLNLRNVYNSNPKLCKECLNIIPYEKKINKFCSKSCSGKFNNKNRKAKVLTKSCKNCFELIQSNRKLCKECYLEIKNVLNNKTIAEAETMNGKQASKYRNIRNNAYSNAKKFELQKICNYCNYSKYVELCHIKPIHKFTKDTLVSEVNKKENLIYLCPNCHWELDHNLIRIN